MYIITETLHIKCKGCGCWRPAYSYLNKTGRILKSCQKCRDKWVRRRINKKKKVPDIV